MLINFAEVFGDGIVGRLFRSLLKVIPDNQMVFIIQGVNKGKKWIKGSGVNGYWLGTYEADHQKLLNIHLKKGDVFYDIGCHVGFFSLFACQRVTDSGHVYCFEPFLKNSEYINKHLKMNRFANFTILNYAISNTKGLAKFQESDKTSMGKVDVNGNIDVQVETVDNLVSTLALKPPTLMKIDVEGLQDQVILGALKTIELYKPTIILEASYDDSSTNFYKTLKGLGYHIQPVKNVDLTLAGDFIATYKQ